MLHVGIVSGEKTIVVADDVSVVSEKAVSGLRSAVRSRWTSRLLAASQGEVATGLALDTKSKDTVELTSCRTRLRFEDWHQIHRARLGLLPVRAMPGSKIPVQTCRQGCQTKETSMHVVSAYTQNAVQMTDRHKAIQEILARLLRSRGHMLEFNVTSGQSTLRPDLVVVSVTPNILIDVTVPYDPANHLGRKAQAKKDKYRHLGTVHPFVVGALRSWWPENDALWAVLQIPPRG